MNKQERQSIIGSQKVTFGGIQERINGGEEDYEQNRSRFCHGFKIVQKNPLGNTVFLSKLL